MLLGIDHLVIAVPDPDAAAAGLESALGIAAELDDGEVRGDRKPEQVERGEDECRVDPAEAREHPPRVASAQRVRHGPKGTGSRAAWRDPGPRTLCLLYTSPSPRDGLLSRMP